MDKDFNFDNSKGLKDLFTEKDVVQSNVYKMDYNAFWHELGHLFGLILAEANGTKLAIAEKIIIKSNCQKITIKEDDFKPLDKTYPCNDFYNQQNKCYEKDDEQRLELKLNDTNRSLYYFSYLLFGGIFHLFIFIENPTLEHFEDCFADDELNVDIMGIYGQAGNDWSKLRRLASLKQWKLVHLKNLRLDIYKFLKKNKIFEKLTPKLEELYEELKNSQTIDGNNLIKSEEKLKEIFKDIPEFTSKYHNKIVKKYIKILKNREAENCIKE